MERVVIVGGTGSGKSTLARRLAPRLSAEHIELDGLWWNPDWNAAGAAELRTRLEKRLRAERWVVDGNYVDEIADLSWPLADTIVWFDLPRRIAVRRAGQRSVRRAVTRTELWNGNRERLSVLSPASLARVWRAWPQVSVRIAATLERLAIPSDAVVRLRSTGELRRWLAACDEMLL